MLTAAYRQTRKIFGEWRCRASYRRELALLCPAVRRELAYRYNINAETSKWFWQA
jgi:hypothetical protein